LAMVVTSYSHGTHCKIQVGEDITILEISMHFFYGYYGSCSTIFQHLLLLVLPSRTQRHPQRILEPHTPNFLVEPITTHPISLKLEVEVP
jgi:hypothetical protein